MLNPWLTVIMNGHIEWIIVMSWKQPQFPLHNRNHPTLTSIALIICAVLGGLLIFLGPILLKQYITPSANIQIMSRVHISQSMGLLPDM